jgi:hypothetical protein
MTVGLIVVIAIAVLAVLGATWSYLLVGPTLVIRGRWSALVLALILLVAMAYLLHRARP